MQFINCPPIELARFVPANEIQGACFSERVDAAKFGGVDTRYHISFYMIDGEVYRVCRDERDPEIGSSFTEVRHIWIPDEIEALWRESRKALMQRERQQLGDLMKKRGIEAIYGGTKGHGWWIKGTGWQTPAECRKLLRKAVPCA